MASEYTKNWVWQLAFPSLDPKLESSEWRLDFAFRLIRWSDYGNRTSQYGWEVGHVQAQVEGGSNFLPNLQAEHWETNLEKERLRLTWAKPMFAQADIERQPFFGDPPRWTS